MDTIIKDCKNCPWNPSHEKVCPKKTCYVEAFVDYAKNECHLDVKKIGKNIWTY